MFAQGQEHTEISFFKSSERTPLNPYWAHLPHRDLITTDGTKLTLINPAFKVQQLIEAHGRDYGIMGKTTGKVQLNPINKLFEIGNEEIYSNASIGIFLASSEYAATSEMIRNADIAMCRAKKSGKDRIDVFNSEMHDQAIQIM